MTWLVLCVSALLAACGLADPIQNGIHEKFLLAQRQMDLSTLFFHIHEPLYEEKYKEIASNWNIEENINCYSNVTAVKIYKDLLKNAWMLPRTLPFSILDHTHTFEAITLFNVLYSAKDYDMFFKTAVHLRDRVNEQLYIYVLSAVIVHRRDTQRFIVPPLYEVLPSFFNNGEIMTTAQRINAYGLRMIEQYSSTYKWNENVVIRWNTTIWPYSQDSTSISYFTHDHGLSALYYNYFLLLPPWLGADVLPLIRINRGEWFWFRHKQLLARYYMERLSNGLGEIPELNTKLFEEGYTSGLLYHNGVPFPSRPNFFLLDQPDYAVKVEEATEYERRIRNAIDKGYILTSGGERLDLRNPEAIDVLGRMVEGSVDSPNANYYKDFISIWKSVLGSSYLKEQQYMNTFNTLVVPSALEHYQTTLRDPAFYAIWKRVLNLFTLWQRYQPPYTYDQLSSPSLTIKNVETDKLITYFEHTYVNISNELYKKDQCNDDISVLVQRLRLNHNKFNVRIHINNDDEHSSTVIVRFFLAPKYDSKGNEIPIHRNFENFYLLDAFYHHVFHGESVINRDSSNNLMTSRDWNSAYDVFLKAQSAASGDGLLLLEDWFLESHTQRLDRFPDRLLLPKGRVGGMPFVFVVYITKYTRLHQVGYGPEYNIESDVSPDPGAARNKDPLGFPFDRPLHLWQVQNLRNMFFKDVLIHHKHTSEMYVPHAE